MTAKEELYLPDQLIYKKIRTQKNDSVLVSFISQDIILTIYRTLINAMNFLMLKKVGRDNRNYRGSVQRLELSLKKHFLHRDSSDFFQSVMTLV